MLYCYNANMKILFICRANTGRSQVAEALYNNLTNSNIGESAGINVDNPGQKLSDREGAVNIIEVMREYGIDMSNNARKQLDDKMVDAYDKLIVIMADPEIIPKWIKANPKTEVWAISDAKGQGLEATRGIVKQIKERVDTI